MVIRIIGSGKELQNRERREFMTTVLETAREVCNTRKVSNKNRRKGVLE